MVRRKTPLLNCWSMARGYWFSEEKWSAWGLLLTVITLNLGIVYILVLLNRWQVNFYEVIQNYKYEGFIQAIGQYSLIATCLVVVRGYQIYTRMLLHIRWRTWMTQQYLSYWLSKKTYYLLQLGRGQDTDNPDQRISEDIELFVWLTLRLSLDLLQDMVTVVSFIVILWNLSGVLSFYCAGYEISLYGYLVWVSILYASIGTYWTVRVGHPLVKMDFDQQRYEADFRFSLMRIRENAESIALYAGENEERWYCHQNFGKIMGNYLSIISVRKKIMWLTSAYTQVSGVFASLVAAPRYFSGHIHLGQMFQIVDAYHHVQTGFSFVVDSFSRLAQWRAVVNRLNHFLLSMEMLHAKPIELYPLSTQCNAGNEYRVENLHIFLPDGSQLIKNFSLSIHRGDRLLIMGSSGCGKSTLLRTFAGIWPYVSGRISRPDKDNIMFVPQKSYMPVQSLEDVLQYPGLANKRSDEELENFLVACKLGHLRGKLHIVADWGQALSLGEQQRVAFVRVLLQKPQWLFLDEATSALDEETERLIYRCIDTELSQSAMVSVGHRHTLTKYHNAKLEFDGAGKWRQSKI